MGAPLAGLKVLDFCWLVVGPMTTRFLAAYGASVVKVESLERIDYARSMAPFKDAQPGLNRGQLFANLNLSKRSLGVNLKRPEGVALMRRFVAAWQPDVVLEGFAPGTMAKWGLDYESLRTLAPNVVYCSTTQYGQSGPFAGYAGFGNVGAATAGFNELTGWPDGDPVGPWSAYNDFVNPPLLLSALIAALIHRERTGHGQYLESSQMETSLHFLAPALLEAQAGDTAPSRMGNRDRQMAPHGVYPCRGDDRYIAIAVPTDDHWRALRTEMGDPPWARDPQYHGVVGRQAHEDALDDRIAAWTQRHDAHALMQRLQAAGVPAGVVQDPGEILRDLQLNHLGYFQGVEHPEGGTTTYETVPFQLAAAAPQVRPAPGLGADSADLLREVLGLSDEEIAEALADGIVQMSL